MPQAAAATVFCGQTDVCEFCSSGVPSARKLWARFARILGGEIVSLFGDGNRWLVVCGRFAVLSGVVCWLVIAFGWLPADIDNCRKPRPVCACLCSSVHWFIVAESLGRCHERRQRLFFANLSLLKKQ